VTKTNAHAYTITVRQRAIDGEEVFEATVAELPDVRGYGDSYTEAYDLAIDAITSLAEAAFAEGSHFPQPMSVEEGDYSGRVTLRLSKTVHRMAAERATAQGVSFNSYLASVITADVTRADTGAAIARECAPLLKQLEALVAQHATHAQASAVGTVVLQNPAVSAAPTSAGILMEGSMVGLLDMLNVAGAGRNEPALQTMPRRLKAVGSSKRV
jgi:predicted HicB family RNase H-like nuclease